MSTEPGAASIDKGTILAFLVAGALAAATLEAEAVTSISDNPIIAAPQLALCYLLAPGLLVSAMNGFLASGAVINGVLYFGLVKFIYWLVTRFRQRAKAQG